MSDTKRAANCEECACWGEPFEFDDYLRGCCAPVPVWASRMIGIGDARRLTRWDDGTDCPVSQKKEVEG